MEPPEPLPQVTGDNRWAEQNEAGWSRDCTRAWHTNSFLHVGELLALFVCVKSLLCTELGLGSSQGPWEGTGNHSLEWFESGKEGDRFTAFKIPFVSAEDAPGSCACLQSLEQELQEPSGITRGCLDTTPCPGHRER